MASKHLPCSPLLAQLAPSPCPLLSPTALASPALLVSLNAALLPS